MKAPISNSGNTQPLTSIYGYPEEWAAFRPVIKSS